MNYNDEKLEHTAMMCHEVNRAYCTAIGDSSQLPWSEAPAWQRNSARNGVEAHVSSGLTMTPEGSHESWMKQKQEEGWVYGEVKDVEKKTHPCMVPYHELPIAQKIKDYLFRGVVHTAYAKE